MANKTDNKKVTGYVRFAGTSRDDKKKNVVTLELTKERAEELTLKLGLDEKKYNGIPIKTTEDGEIYLKATSGFNVPIYEGAAPSDIIDLADIGKGSKVQLFIGIGETKYKNKLYQVAYLKSVSLIDLVEPVDFNPFDSDEVEEV